MEREAGAHGRRYSEVESVLAVLPSFCDRAGEHLLPPCSPGGPHLSWLLVAAGIEGSDDDALVTGEQDEELSRWEQEQIRKGINIPQVRTSKVTKYI